MKMYGFTAVCAAVLLVCGCNSLKYGELDGRVYTSGDKKVQITFPEGAAPQITAGYLENKYTCPDDFEAIYLDRTTGSFLVCSAVIPPEQLKSADVKKTSANPERRSFHICRHCPDHSAETPLHIESSGK